MSKVSVELQWTAFWCSKDNSLDMCERRSDWVASWDEALFLYDQNVLVFETVISHFRLSLKLFDHSTRDAAPRRARNAPRAFHVHDESPPSWSAATDSDHDNNMILQDNLHPDLS
jgi:hypothetical protein